MKLKSWHYILIVVLAIELIVLTVFIINNRNSELFAELSIDYENENGIYVLESLLDNYKLQPFTFERAGQKYEFDGDIAELSSCYLSFEAFKEKYPDATEMVWNTYKVNAYQIAYEAINPETHPKRNVNIIASSWYGVDERLLSASPTYTISFTDSYSDWSKIFSQYEVVPSDSNVLTEMVMPATVTLNNNQYVATAHMVKNGDTVRINILFGTEYIEDFTAQMAEINIHTPDGAATIAHTSINTSFLAGTTESRFREIIKNGV